MRTLCVFARMALIRSNLNVTRFTHHIKVPTKACKRRMGLRYQHVGKETAKVGIISYLLPAYLMLQGEYHNCLSPIFFKTFQG